MEQEPIRTNEDAVKRINEIDDAIVQILQNESNADDQEYRAKVTEMVQTIKSKGQIFLLMKQRKSFKVRE
jgi:hypothetical protein